MKAHTYICILLTSLFSNCGSSSNTHPKGDCLTLLIDRTDPMTETNEVAVKDFLPLLQVTSSNTLASAHVSFAPISNLRFEKVYSVTIPETDRFSVNEIDRKDQIDTFKAQMSQVLGWVKKMPVGIEGSAIFENMANGLNDLAMCNTCDVKRMIVLSDLCQNMSWFCAYNQGEVADFVRNQDDFNDEMESNCPIKHPLNGISVYLIHRPGTVVDDERFYKISGLLKNFLESKGATVNISTSIQ